MEKVDQRILTAEEAFKVTIENRMTFSECMKHIVSQAEGGNAFACFYKQIEQDAIDRLMDMGYKLGTFKDPMDQRFFKITWNE